jgi:hypothetical protein
VVRRRVCHQQHAGRMRYPLVRELPASGILVTVTCRGAQDRPPALLPLARCASHNAELSEAYLAIAL